MRPAVSCGGVALGGVGPLDSHENYHLTNKTSKPTVEAVRFCVEFLAPSVSPLSSKAFLMTLAVRLPAIVVNSPGWWRRPTPGRGCTLSVAYSQ